MKTKIKREIFNFKNQQCQKMFFEVSDATNKLTSCFQSAEGFQKQSKVFFKTLNGTFQQCFKKVRITNKSKNNKESNNELQNFLELKTKLQSFIRIC